jgi:hypothetical protein
MNTKLTDVLNQLNVTEERQPKASPAAPEELDEKDLGQISGGVVAYESEGCTAMACGSF